MKRIISILLTSAMVLSLAGCSKTEETKKKKKKTKKTTSTEITETEDPETETDVPTDTDETETDPSVDPTGPDKLVFNHDLQMLRFVNNRLRNDYAELCEKLDNEMFWVCSSCDQYQLSTPGYDNLSSFLDMLADEMKSDSDNSYNLFLSQLDTYMEEADQDNVWSYSNHFKHNFLNIIRADEKVMSFSVDTILQDTARYDTSAIYYTFDSKTGNKLSLTDIVTDMNAFADAVEEYETSHFYAYTPAGLFTTMADHLRKGELDEIRFSMNQNCLILHMDFEDSVGELDEYVCYVSALQHMDCIDPSYFTDTTANFTLTTDSANKIFWDFDEDGNLDELVIDYKENYTTNDYPVFDLTFTLNGTTCYIADNDYFVDDVTGCYELGNMYLMYENGEYYFYLEGYIEDPTDPYFVFRMNDYDFEYLGYCDQISWYPYNPDDCFVQIRGDLLGTGSFSKPSSFLTKTGMPVSLGSFYFKTGVGITKEKMKLGLFDDNGQPTSESIEIPANTAVLLIGIDTEKELAYFMTLHRDSSENEFFQMVLTCDPDYEYYDVTFNGKSSYELFTGSFYYD